MPEAYVSTLLSGSTINDERNSYLLYSRSHMDDPTSLPLYIDELEVKFAGDLISNCWGGSQAGGFDA